MVTPTYFLAVIFQEECLRACLKTVAAKVTRRTTAQFGQEIRLVTSAATMPVVILKQGLRLAGP